MSDYDGRESEREGEREREDKFAFGVEGSDWGVSEYVCGGSMWC